MKKISVLLTLLLLLAACSSDVKEPKGSAYEVAGSILSEQALSPMQALPLEQEAFSVYLSGYYGIDAAALTDGFLCYAGGLEASELAVLYFETEAEATQAKANLESYRTRRAADFVGYAPQEAALVSDGVVAQEGRAVALLLCPDAAAAQEAFSRAFAEGWEPVEHLASYFAKAAPTQEEAPSPSPEVSAPPSPTPSEPLPTDEPVLESPIETAPPEPSQTTEPEPPVIEEPTPTPSQPPEEPVVEVPDVYDPAAILAAWQAGSSAALSPKNAAIYDAAAQVIATQITDDMRPYDKELAIHDYIINQTRYDPAALSHAIDATQSPNNDNPYGVFYEGYAICSGYSSTFQLFMDLLGIPCITIHATAQGGNEHAWNMVQLDEEWYCVDVTWDDPVGNGDILRHDFFNVTTNYLRATQHEWSDSSVPEATADTYAYGA